MRELKTLDEEEQWEDLCECELCGEDLDPNEDPICPNCKSPEPL
jgi:hypothetical protein